MSCSLLSDADAASTHSSAGRQGSCTSSPSSRAGGFWELGHVPDRTVKQPSCPIKARYDHGRADCLVNLCANVSKLAGKSLCKYACNCSRGRLLGSSRGLAGCHDPFTSALSGNCLSRGRLLLWPDLAPALTILGEIYPHYLINHLRLGHAAPVRNLCSESAVLDRDVATPSRKLQCDVHLFDHRVKVGHGDWVPMDAVNVKLEAAG